MKMIWVYTSPHSNVAITLWLSQLGTIVHHFETSSDFSRWKETIEEESFVYYTKEKEYKPSEGIKIQFMHYIIQ